MDFLRKDRCRQGAVQEAPDDTSVFAAQSEAKRVFAVRLPTHRCGKDVVLHFFKGGGIGQGMFFVTPLPHGMPRRLPAFVDFAGRNRFERAQDCGKPMRGTVIDCDNAVDVIGHQGERFQSDIAEYPRKVPPMGFNSAAGRIRFHAPAGNFSQTGRPLAHADREEIQAGFCRAVFDLQVLGKQISRGGVLCVRFHIVFQIIVFNR